MFSPQYTDGAEGDSGEMQDEDMGDVEYSEESTDEIDSEREEEEPARKRSRSAWTYSMLGWSVQICINLFRILHCLLFLL